MDAKVTVLRCSCPALLLYASRDWSLFILPSSPEAPGTLSCPYARCLYYPLIPHSFFSLITRPFMLTPMIVDSVSRRRWRPLRFFRPLPALAPRPSRPAHGARYLFLFTATILRTRPHCCRAPTRSLPLPLQGYTGEGTQVYSVLLEKIEYSIRR